MNLPAMDVPFFQKQPVGVRRELCFSTYQRMAVISLLYVLPVLWLTSSPNMHSTDIAEGLEVLWQPATIVGLQFEWAAVFFIPAVAG